MQERENIKRKSEPTLSLAVDCVGHQGKGIKTVFAAISFKVYIFSS
jgi:hypothetical protein